MLIISSDPSKKGRKDASERRIQHCIEWDEDTDPKALGRAIEQVLEKVQGTGSSLKTSKVLVPSKKKAPL